MRNGAAIVLVMLGLVLGGSSPVTAEIEGIQLQVDGLSCPFCALGLDKRLKQRAGLEGIQVHLKQGVTEATLPRGHGIDVGKVRRAVQEAGFTLRGIKLTVIGKIGREGDHVTVTSRHDGTTFLLFDAEHQDTEASSTLSQALRQQLEHAQQTNRVVKLSGSVHEHAGLPTALMVESFRELSALSKTTGGPKVPGTLRGLGPRRQSAWLFWPTGKSARHFFPKGHAAGKRAWHFFPARFSTEQELSE